MLFSNSAFYEKVYNSMAHFRLTRSFGILITHVSVRCSFFPIITTSDFFGYIMSITIVCKRVHIVNSVERVDKLQ